METTKLRIREAVGRTLRDLRSKRRLSLDDVEALTRESGVRVTRSHLSRVETGHADIALPRFLCLLRALGEPPSHATTLLDALLDPDSCRRDRLPAEVRGLLTAGDPAAAARACRAARASRRRLTPALMAMWAIAESRLGCWTLAERALRDAMPQRIDDDAPLLGLAVASLGAGREGVAVALARAAATDSPVARLVQAAARLAAGEVEESGRLASGIALGETPELSSRTIRGLSLGIAAEAYRRAGHRRSALRTAERACQVVEGSVLRAESMLLHARCLGSLRRPAAGLRLLSRARDEARRAGVPALIGAVHEESRRLWLLAGDRGAARASSRAARAVFRRHGADRPPAAALPLNGLFDQVMAAAPSEVLARRGREERPHVSAT